jgi:predicted DNA-binding transcriptional regulator AlpA
MATLTNALPHLLDEREIAAMLGVSLATVRRWRCQRRGPRYRKIGASVRYLPEDVTAWLATRPTGGEPIKGVR